MDKKPFQKSARALEFLPDAMRSFRRGVNDALVLDDVRDLQFWSTTRRSSKANTIAWLSLARLQVVRAHTTVTCLVCLLWPQ